MGLFETPSGGSVCNGNSTSGGGSGSGDPITGVSGTVSAIVIVDPSGTNNPWDGRVTITGAGGEVSSTGSGGLVVHIGNPGDLPGGSVTIDKVGVSSIDVTAGVSGTVTVNVASSIAISGTNAAGGGGSLQVQVSSLGGVNGLVVYNGNEQGGGSTTINKVGVSSIDPGVNVGVSGYDSSDVKVTLDGEMVSVHSTSGLLFTHISLSAADSIPISNATLVSAPTTGYRIVVYQIQLTLYGTGSVQGSLFLTNGDDTGTNRIAFVASFGTAVQNISMQNFHGVALDGETALKYSATESTTNAFGYITVWYRVVPI